VSVAEEDQQQDGRWLVCGDFNIPASPWLGNDHSVVVCPESAQPTYPAHWPVEPIDLWVTPGPPGGCHRDLRLFFRTPEEAYRHGGYDEDDQV
jgi:hypothetical protein